MSALKTRPGASSVQSFLETLEAPRRDESRVLLQMMQSLTGEPPRLWGPSIVGFGSYHFRYANGREGDWFLTGFSPRRRELVVYVMTGFADAEARLARLGPHRKGKSCLYIRRLEQVDTSVLAEVIEHSVSTVRERYGDSHVSSPGTSEPS
jgi:hypothetical protein